MDTNWYVIQVLPGREDKVAEKLKTVLRKDLIIDIFVPKYKKMRKTKKKWIEIEEVLFPEYVFLVTDYIEEVFVELKSIIDMTVIIGRDEYDIYSIRLDELRLIERFVSRDKVIEMSYGYIEGDQVFIQSGPLFGYEGLIKKIDRHKRIAYLDVEMFGQVSNVKVGLEIISKK